MMKQFSALVLAAALLSAAGTAAVAATPMAPTIAEPHSATEVIVGFAPGTPGSAKANARAAAGAVRQEALSPLAADAEVLHLASGRTPEAAIAALSRNPNVRYVEPNYLLQATEESNDTYFTNDSLWGMYSGTSSPSNEFGSHAADVWKNGYTGSANKYVVVIDEGINWAHPDLQANTWVNPGEIRSNRVDDDKNGYVDDIQGWDFFHNDNTVYDVREDSHGTHVSGTIGGVGGNGTGVAGVNWDVTLISAKFLGPRGGSLDDAVKAVDYANTLKDKGVDIVATNNSWGGGAYSTALHEAINRGGDRGILFIAAAGNSGKDNDVTASYPSNYQCTKQTSSTNVVTTRDWDCVVAVAAIDKTGELAYFSQYGATTVDLGAPGVGIVSTLPGNTYGSYSGTSMATPHVSGAAALCASIGGLEGKALREALISSVTYTTSLDGKTATGGRLDVSNFPTLCSGPLAIATMSLPSGQVGIPYSQTLAATGGKSPYTWTAAPLPTGLTLSGNTITGTPLQPGTSSVVVTVTDSASPTASQTAPLSLTIASATKKPAPGSRR